MDEEIVGRVAMRTGLIVPLVVLLTGTVQAQSLQPPQVLSCSFKVVRQIDYNYLPSQYYVDLSITLLNTNSVTIASASYRATIGVQYTDYFEVHASPLRRLSFQSIPPGRSDWVLRDVFMEGTGSGIPPTARCRLEFAGP